MLKNILGRIIGNLVAQAILFALGGAGAMMAAFAVWIDLIPANPWGLALIGLGSAFLFLGAFAAYQRAHPLPNDPELRENRRKKIGEWRALVANRTASVDDVRRVLPSQQPTTLIESGLYIEMEEHLSEEVRAAFWEEPDKRLFDRAHDPLRSILLAELARLEKEWGLV